MGARLFVVRTLAGPMDIDKKEVCKLKFFCITLNKMIKKKD